MSDDEIFEEEIKYIYQVKNKRKRGNVWISDNVYHRTVMCDAAFDTCSSDAIIADELLKILSGK